ncbi:putative pab-dependent poly -specific ribonuclease subunit pan2 protein [Neofusicoccum parvum UCRNP2]|uniref:Putative pab-dependent poly-specific ribonuclease subunit pan2 protein n=1 Tax=Botryosphaeria parva (strain UCR-NP2) TaxID=1287680 RepID=R1EIS8_BOTPV|nr:putative pab-dependent poly -specific ribonuclease subunit pan2 protein [Neofusicoccum parvum UCRNP2]
MPTPATTVAFDTHQDLLWAGNDYGRVCSFFGPELQRYTSYRAHPSPEGPVKQLLFCDKGVLSISVRSVHLASRRGLTQWHLTNDAFKDLRCMSFTSKGVHEVLVAGCQDTMFRIDVEKGTLTETLPAENSYTMMKKGGQYICAATTTGMVQIIDPLTFKVVKSWQAHKEWINDMDAKSDFLVTCGYSRRQLNNLILDPFAYVYDLKTLLPLPPIPFHVGAAFVRMHPRMSTTSIVSSQSGQLQVVDLMNPNTANVRQVNLYDTYLTCLEMAPSGEALALTDAMSSVRIWGSPTKVQSTRLPEKDNPLKAPKFLSEKARDGNGSNQAERRMSETLEALTDMMLDGATKKDVPVMYRNVEIKYSRFGVDDFDFKRPGASLVHELVYPPKNTMKNPMRASRPTFSQILKASVERQDQNRGWCDRCKRYQQLAARKTIQNVPPILMINAAIHSHEAKQLWATPNWLPEKIGIIVNQGQFFCYEGQDLEHHLRRNFYDIQVYELVGVVADINSGENQKSHLVSMINVAPSSRTDETETKWHLFNDFLVRPVTKEEALRFEPNWKLPSVLTYESVKASHHIDDSWKENLDTSLLYRTWGPNESDNLEYKPLHPNEHPGPGWPVAIDAEFVSLQREEIEISASGQRETIRPSRLGLARVSVLRGGDGEDEGKPFIDDYIAITEPIVDYLTLFSGISPGDLDRATSKHALVGLKVAYKKLWLLLNLGCLFIGHGLPKDFRTINIHVPKAQVVDTVDLYYIPARQRKLSLRFLAWIVLEEDIQQDTHDSVEDARTALKLWQHWRAVEDGEGKAVCDEMVKDIYKRGWEVGFKVPRVGGGGTGGARGDAMTPEPSVAGASTPTRAAAGTPVRPGTGGWRPPPGVSFGSPSPMK